MNWQDMLLEQEFDHEVLRDALAAAFELSPAEVSVVDAIEKAPRGVRVVVAHYSTQGDFRCLLSVYVSAALASSSPVEVTRRLCTRLDVRALISDESPNPYSMILIDQAGQALPVFLDVDSLDQREAYCLAHEGPGHT